MSDPKKDPYNGELENDADLESDDAADDVAAAVPGDGDAKGLRTEGSGPLP